MTDMTSVAVPFRQIAVHAARDDNVVIVRMLALCPMLAVSVSVSAAAVLGALTLAVMAVSGFIVAGVRNWTPDGVRLPIFLLVVASLVAIADLGMEAHASEMHRQLGIFLPLIITNCAVLARLELFARNSTPLAAFTDGVASGAGMLLAIITLATAREWLSTGGIAPFFTGSPILPSAALPAGGFILFGLMLAASRKLRLPVAS